ITKSGTNQIHGTGFVQFRDARWAADQRVDKCDPVVQASTGTCVLSKKPPFDRQIGGGSLGFPFWKNKVFGHVSYEQNNTDSQRFTAVAEFPSFNGTFGSPVDERMASGRVDWNITDRIRSFYRWNYNYNNGVTGYGARDLAAFSNLNNTNSHVAGLDLSSPTWTHQIRFSYLNFNNFIVDANKQAGTPDTLDPKGQPILVRILNRLQDVGPDLLAPQTTFQDNKMIKYDGAKILRDHTFRFGVEYNHIVEAGIFNFFGNAPRIRASYTSGSIAFASTSPFAPGGAGNPLNFPLNQIVFGNGLGAGSEKPALGFPSGGFYNNRIGLYFQDSWKIRPNFTLNAGVRWNYNDGLSNGDLERAPFIAAFDPRLAGKPRIPKDNFAPQVGFAWDLGGKGKTVIRAGAGIFYETNIINNISYDRALNLPPGLGNDTPVITAGNPNLLDPGTGAVLVDFSGDFGKPLGSVIDKVVAAQAQYQAVAAALASHWPPPGTLPLVDQLGGTGGNDLVDTHYRTPYSAMMNVGIQREIRNGLVLSVDYIRNRGVGFNIIRDRNRLGAANTLDKPIAVSSINAAFADNGCGGGLTPGTAAWNTAVNCFVGQGLGITDLADYGLDAGSALDGYAFRGSNPNYRDMLVIENNGLSLYQALQVRLTGQLGSWGPFKHTTTNITYALGRFSATGVDQDFLSSAAYNDAPTKFFGPSNLDRTHILGITFVTDVPLGFRISTTNSIKTALASSMFLPDGSPSGSGEIFFTDLDGDGVTLDPLPGTNRGSFSRDVKAGDVNKVIDNYNSQVAGGFTPAAQALVSAGLFTGQQLKDLGAVIPTINNAPSNQRGNPNFVNTDIRIARPIKIGERFIIEPQLEVFNLFNFGNYDRMATTLLDGTPGSPNGTPSGLSPLDSGLSRVGSGSGSFAPGTMRALQFNIRVTF
ncbi:MAG TPA: TonB-dependent receptor, partial [Terriglobales bacterium]|nr:TonB-dependent receptor [Terriglobales bacterium]